MKKITVTFLLISLSFLTFAQNNIQEIHICQNDQFVGGIFNKNFRLNGKVDSNKTGNKVFLQDLKSNNFYASLTTEGFGKVYKIHVKDSIVLAIIGYTNSLIAGKDTIKSDSNIWSLGLYSNNNGVTKLSKIGAYHRLLSLASMLSLDNLEVLVNANDSLIKIDIDLKSNISTSKSIPFYSDNSKILLMDSSIFIYSIDSNGSKSITMDYNLENLNETSLGFLKAHSLKNINNSIFSVLSDSNNNIIIYEGSRNKFNRDTLMSGNGIVTFTNIQTIDSNVYFIINYAESLLLDTSTYTLSNNSSAILLTKSNSKITTTEIPASSVHSIYLDSLDIVCLQRELFYTESSTAFRHETKPSTNRGINLTRFRIKKSDPTKKIRSEALQMVIFPVPSENYINVTGVPINTKYEIFNPQGQLIQTGNISQENNLIKLNNKLSTGTFIFVTNKSSTLFQIIR